MKAVATLIEVKSKADGSDTTIYKGVYQMADGSFQWLTATRSGTCKALKTALRKVGAI